MKDQPEGARVHTVLHETYEIIHETLCDLHAASPPPITVCREANRFAAAVLLQPDAFSTACCARKQTWRVLSPSSSSFATSRSSAA